jgi:protein-glucosylgalactosylhydroxylysine glucosidase
MKTRLLSLRIYLLSCLFFQMASAQMSSAINPWVISAVPDPANYYGVTVANGMIGIVSSPQPFQVKDVVLAGAYDLYGRGRVSNFLKSFNLLNMHFNVDGAETNAKNISSLKQTLDMQRASFTTSFNIQDKASVTYTYYALRQLPFTVLMDITVVAKKDIEIEPASVMEAPDALRDVQNYYNEIDRPHVVISLLTSTAKSPTGKLLMCASNTFIFNEPHGQEPRLIHEMWDNNMHLLKFKRKLKAGETYRFSIAGSSITSAHDEDPLNEAERLTIFAKLQGTERLIEFHEKAWNDIWKTDIQVTGDEQAQQDIHSMLYHLYSFTREGTSFSLSPMGLSGLGYNGHVFWDADLWMFPALLVLHPEMAKSMIEYRYERLDAARKNAFSHGYKGAMFPWESAASGVEETPVWALSGPFEHHITACVGLAAWNYYCVTQDKVWLREKGWPILSATADFWASRVERNGPGKYDIRNVVAADEWAENVDNNAFTNGAAKVLLQHATEAAGILGIKADPDWMVVSENIPILQLDGITREHAGYHGEGIKQADVNLLAYPLKLITDPVQVKKILVIISHAFPTMGLRQ